eukprot:s542_g3.t1
MALDEEGQEIHVEDIREWSAMSPVRGQVIEVFLPGTDLNEPPEAWAAFLILQVSTRLDGSIVLRVMHLGCQGKDIGKQLDTRFNTAECCLHLCLSQPCVDVGGEGTALPDTYLHVTRIRLWTLEAFGEQQDYITEARMKQGAKWLTERPKTPAGTRRAGALRPAPKRERKPAGKAAAGKKPAAKESKLTAAEKAKLRDKLKDTRQRLQGRGDASKKRKKTEEEDRGAEVISDEDSSNGYSAGGSNYAPEDGDLKTGTELVGPLGELAKAEARDRTRKKRSRGAHSDPPETRKASRGNSSKTLSGQLVERALELTKSQREKKRRKDKKKKTPAQELSNVLTKILTKSKGEDQKDSKEERKKKKKKRTLRDGTIVSCSESYETSSYAGSEEETSDGELEAPLRKKSRDKPGSVLTLLVAHVREQLDQGALTNLAGTREEMLSGVKVMSYFNLNVKGTYPGHIRELREMHHLAACIDLMRSGDIARAADGMAARFIALHQSLVDQSWSTAKHLELHPLEESSAAGPAAILATRKHAKLVAKMQGYPSSSWTSSPGRGGKGGKGKGDWTFGDSRNDQKGDAKGRGKGKKGKGKWGPWQRKDWAGDKEKQEEKPKT